MNNIPTFFVNKLSFNSIMSTSKTIGAIAVSILLGAVTFFIAAPKKVIRKKEKEVSEPLEENSSVKEDLFI